MKSVFSLALCTLSIALCGTYTQLQGQSCQGDSNHCTTNSCSTSCSTDSCLSTSCNGGSHCKPSLLPFSQGENRARDYAGVEHFQFLADQTDSYWHAGLAIEYNENFDRDRLGSYFFPNDNTLTVGPNNTGADIRNVDIGLSDTFVGRLKIEPRIRNIVIEPAVYLGLDHWLAGAYVWLKVPITHTRWELECCETDSTLGGIFFGQVSEMSFGVSTPVPTSGINQIQQAFSGTTTWGDKTTPLESCRISCCKSQQNGVADLPIHIGWTFLERPQGYLGVYLRTVVPTGKQAHSHHGHTIFDARVGYDHWQVGGGANLAIKIHSDERTSYNFFIDAYATHIFKKTQCRCFDLKANGCMSRYLLMKEADSNGLYTGNLVTFADIFNVCATSQFDWNVDALAFFNIQNDAFGFDIGYEFKGRDREKFDCECPFTLCDSTKDDPCNTDCCLNEANIIGTKQYGIKGTTLVQQAGTLINTQSTSTISASGPTDTTPVFINATNFASQLDLNGTAYPRALSHKLWANLSYYWDNYSGSIFATLGGEVEWTNQNNAPRVWGIWAKTGVAYS